MFRFLLHGGVRSACDGPRAARFTAHTCIPFLAKIKNYFLMSLKLTDEQQSPCLELLRCDMFAETQYSGGIWL